MGHTLLLFIDTYFYLNKRKSIQSIYKDFKVRMTKQFFWLKQKAAKATFFWFIFRVRERILGSVKAERKNRNLILLEIVFILGKRLILGNFDTTIGKICISRPLGATLGKRYLINKAKNHCLGAA